MNILFVFTFASVGLEPNVIKNSFSINSIFFILEQHSLKQIKAVHSQFCVILMMEIERSRQDVVDYILVFFSIKWNSAHQHGMHYSSNGPNVA